MKIFILGATGQTGTLLTKRLVESGAEVKAYVRDSKRMKIEANNLVIEEGEVHNIDQLTKSMKGYDVVVSCLGGNANKKDYVLARLIKNVVDAMNVNGISRIVSISSAGIENELGFIGGIFVVLFYKNAINDHKQAANYIKENTKNYTIVRPLSLVNGETTENYRISELGVPKRSSKISREDLSHFMFDVIINSKYIGKSVCPAY